MTSKSTGGRSRESTRYTVAVNALLAEGGHRYATFRRGAQRAVAGKQYEMVNRWLARSGEIAAPTAPRITRLTLGRNERCAVIREAAHMDFTISPTATIAETSGETLLQARRRKAACSDPPREHAGERRPQRMAVRPRNPACPRARTWSLRPATPAQSPRAKSRPCCGSCRSVPRLRPGPGRIRRRRRATRRGSRRGRRSRAGHARTPRSTRTAPTPGRSRRLLATPLVPESRRRAASPGDRCAPPRRAAPRRRRVSEVPRRHRVRDEYPERGQETPDERDEPGSPVADRALPESDQRTQRGRGADGKQCDRCRLRDVPATGRT